MKRTSPRWPYRTIVEIQWEDAVSKGGWQCSQNAGIEYKGSPCRTVGYLVRKTRTEVVIAQNTSCNEQDVGEVMVIPLGIVRKTRIVGRLG